MSNFIIAIAVFVITVIGALFAVPYFIDWNGYRGAFEEEATRLLGREVRVGGAVNLHLLPTPYFRLEKVRIADASVNLQEPFFRADSVALKLSVPPFFRGVVEANEIEFQRPVLRLALDDKDGWNWQSFGQTLGNAAYMPANVALTSVKITDGVLAVHGPNGAERTRLEGVDGELSAPALDGPYRFRGTFGKGRGERELRIATARPEADGAVRFKASLRLSEANSIYTIDGRLIDLMGRPRVDGELTAKLPLGGLWRSRGEAAAPARTTGAGEEAAFDLKANVRLDPAGAALSDLALSFEQDGRPQLITGDLTARWRDTVSVDMNLASRWLDLDRIVAAGEGAGPIDSVIPLALRMRDLLPAEGRSRATISVDQANIGREAISGLKLSLVRTPDKLEIEQLRVGMPGGSRGELQGVVSGPPGAAVLDGNLGVRGTSLIRFLGWASGRPLPVDTKGDGTFGIRAKISIGPTRAEAREIVGDLSGTAVYGTASYAWEKRPELSIQVEAPQLDARALMPAGSSLGDLLDGIIYGSAAAERGPDAAKPGWRNTHTDAKIRLSAGQVITAARTYRDVAMQLELKGDRLRLPLLRVAGDDGFSLELEGEVQQVASRPKGSVRAVATAETAQSIAPLAELLGMPEGFRPGERRAQALAPLRMAGSLTFGTRTATSTDLVLDGEANGAAVQLSGRFDGAAGGWRAGAADVTVTLEGADTGALAALLAPGRSPARAENGGPGRLIVKASGVPSEGLACIASIEAGDVGLDFRGRITLADAGNAVAGELEVKTADGTRMAALAGLSPPLRLDGVPVAGTLKLSASAAGIELDRLALKVGGSDVRGRIALAAGGDRRRIEARLAVDEVSVARLLAPLLDQRLVSVTGAAEAAIGGRQALWPDEPFDASALEALEGSIHLDAKRLSLSDGIGLGQASLDVAIEGGRLEVKQLEGTALGGRYQASLRIEKVPAGAEVTGSLRLTGGTLQALDGSAGWKPRATGTIAGEIKFSARGQSPRSAISVLQGGGTLEFGEARLATLWPGAIGVAAEAALKAEPDKLAATLRQALAASLGSGQPPLPGRIAVDIADGQLAAKAFVINTAEGRAQATASLDLRTLILESEWRLEQKPGAGPGDKALPAVIVTYRGPVAALGSLEPRIATDALERELAVRRMERDVEELERLRKLDETRRRSDAERLRRQLEQAPPPVPVPVAPAPPGGTRPAAPG